MKQKHSILKTILATCCSAIALSVMPITVQAATTAQDGINSTLNATSTESTNIDGKAVATVDKSGTYILLNRRYVEDVWENDIIPPSAASVQQGNMDIVFVIDRSASMDSNDPNGIRKEVVKEFISKLRDEDRAAIVQFTAIAETIMPITNDKEALINAVDSVENSDGGGCTGSDQNAGTNGSAGIRNALDELNGSSAKHKYIIFLTDGDDNRYLEGYNNIYILDSIIANEHTNKYLRTAASNIKGYFVSMYNSDVKTISGFVAASDYMMPVLENALMEDLHLLIASNTLGAIVEIGRSIANIYGVDKMCEQASKTVASAQTASILSKVYLNHLNGGDAFLVVDGSGNSIWVSYSDYTAKLYSQILDVISIRIISESEVSSDDFKQSDAIKNGAKQNITTLSTALEGYNSKLLYFLIS